MLVRVATYNVQSLRAGVEAVAGAVAPAHPDLLLVQECGSKPRLGRFARVVGMEFSSSHRPFNRVRNAVAYRPAWRVAGLEVRDLSREGRTLRRGLIAVTLRRGTARLTAVSAHLGLAGRERERHAVELTDYLAGVQPPFVLGVDLNEEPEGPAARWIAGRLFDVYALAGRGPGRTFPARAPTARIDFLFASDGVGVVRAWVGAEPAAALASDHLPVFADLELERD